MARGHKSKKALELIGTKIGNQTIKELFYCKGIAIFKVYCDCCKSLRDVRYKDAISMQGNYCNNCFSFEKFKKDFYNKFPNSKLKLLKKDKSKIIVKDEFGYCKVEFKYLIENGNTSIMSAVFPTAYFINRLKYLLDEPLDYSKVNYKNYYEKINLTCKKHGSFLSRICNINEGIGCFKCKNEKVKTKKFIERAKKVHGDTFSYKNCIFKNSLKEVTITCKVHGDFYQIPGNHLKGNGCSKCFKILSTEKQKNNFNLRSYSGWEKMGKNSKHFDSFKVYIIRFFNENEEFYKIGKTFNTVKNRFFKEIKLGYNYQILKIIEGDANHVSKLEKLLHKEHKEYFYKPFIPFKGMQECFKFIDLNKIEEIINANKTPKNKND
jgi:hypothetical protein